MKSIIILFSILTFSNLSYGGEIKREQIKVRLYVSYATSIKGTIELSDNKLSFRPVEANNLAEKYFHTLPYDSFKELNFDFKDVKGIYRRNTFLIFPNNFLIKTNDGKKYKFYSYKRMKVLKVFKDYKKNGV